MIKRGNRLVTCAALLVAATLSGCDRAPTASPEFTGAALTTSCTYAVGIDGPRLVDPGETVTYTAYHTGCAGTFSYRWLYSTGGSYTTVGGSSDTYTRIVTTAPFYLTVRMFSGSTGTLLDESDPILVQY
ncbi:MAG TPA: hypothetical protein VE913_19665 [Longimicrobium sp.]|nr:hypothetical protein [Longimicrobium sp.]